MIIENSDALKVWLTSCLGRMCDADPAALAKYVLALVKKEKAENELREFCLDQLEVFLLKDTKHFVDLLFETLKTKSYLYKTDSIVPLSNTESVNNLTVNSSKKLNSSDGREKTDAEKDSTKPENVPKSKSSHFSNSRKHTKVSGRVSRENRDRNRSRSHSSSSQSSCSSSRERLKDKSGDVSSSKHKKEFLKLEDRQRELLHDGSNYSHAPYHLNNTKGSNRCKDYDEKGYCMQGDLCIYDHGADPVVLENVHGLNFGVSLGAHVPANENSIVSAAPLDITKSPLPPPPPTSPPPLPPPPPPLPPLPVTGPYMPEPYNPEAPAMNITSPADISSYWMPPNMHIPSLHHSRSQPVSGMSNTCSMLPQHNSKTRSRELIGVPTVEVRENNKNVSLKTISTVKKRKGFDYSRLGPKPKRMMNFSEATCRTLELKCVPKHLNTISLLNSHFSKFGNVTNIEVFYNGDPEAALIQFQTVAEAALAHDSTDAVLNNRFIQVFWHNKEEKHKIEKKETSHLKEVLINNSQMNDVEKLRVSSGTSSRTFNAEKNIEKLPERSVVYSRGSICRTVYNPSVLKKVDTSAANLSLGTPKEDKKVNKKMELFKKKQDFLESQLKHQKFILEKLSSAKNDKERAVLKEMLDSLGKKIKECQQDLKDFFKQCNSQKTSPISTKTEAEKMLLDAELDLYNTLNKCESDGQQDTAELLLLKVNELKQKAKALGLKESTHEMGLRSKRRHLPFSKSKNSLKIDNRPKTLFVSGTKEKDVKKYFLQQLSDIEKIEERKTGFIVTFKTRKAAETAFSGSKLGNENVSVSWFLDNRHSVSEDIKESNVPKVKNDNADYAEGDEDEDEEEDSEARSWRR